MTYRIIQTLMTFFLPLLLLSCSKTTSIEDGEPADIFCRIDFIDENGESVLGTYTESQTIDTEVIAPWPGNEIFIPISRFNPDEGIFEVEINDFNFTSETGESYIEKEYIILLEFPETMGLTPEEGELHIVYRYKNNKGKLLEATLCGEKGWVNHDHQIEFTIPLQKS